MVKDLGFFVTVFYHDKADELSKQPLISDDIRVITTRFTIGVKCFANTEVFQDETEEVTIVLYGQIYDGVCLSHLVELYKTQGISSVKSLNGSFALLLIDKSQGKTILVTDRLCSRKLYLYKKNSAIFVSTVLKHLFTSDLSLDPIGLAWYFSNGVVHNNRTIFSEICRLDRAACYIFCADKKEEVLQYWQYQFTNEYARKNIQDVKDELATLLIDSVKKRVYKDSPLFLSLSGGYDAAGILGILSGKLHVNNLCSFSYGLNETDVKNDAYVARHEAEMCGITHRFYLSYDENFCNAIERNALWGDGLSYFCDESLVWSGFYDKSDGQNYPLFVGDECFGWVDIELSNNEDALAASRIWNFNSLSWLKGFLSPNVYHEFLEGQNQDISALLKKIPHTNDLHDIKDFVYLDQRLCHIILPWRENYTNRVFAVQDPFLDNTILDFIQKVPSKWRRGKYLYKETIAAMFPKMFTLNRAKVCGYVPNWNTELLRDMDSVKSNYFQNGSSSLLDKYIDPDSVMRLILIEDEIPYKLLLNTYKTVKKTLHTGGQKIFKRTLPYKITRTVFNLRYLVLKRYLEIAKQESLLQKGLDRSSRS